MNLRQLVSQLPETLLRGGGILVLVIQREGNKQQALHLAQEIPDFSLGVIEITTSIQSRVAYEKYALGHFFTPVRARQDAVHLEC